MQALNIIVAKVEFTENGADFLDLRFIWNILLTSCVLRWEKYLKIRIVS